MCAGRGLSSKRGLRPIGRARPPRRPKRGTPRSPEPKTRDHRGFRQGAATCVPCIIERRRFYLTPGPGRAHTFHTAANIASGVPEAAKTRQPLRGSGAVLAREPGRRRGRRDKRSANVSAPDARDSPPSRQTWRRLRSKRYSRQRGHRQSKMVTILYPISRGGLRAARATPR